VAQLLSLWWHFALSLSYTMEHVNPVFLGSDEVLGQAIDACSTTVEEHVHFSRLLWGVG
jgi:hypothetical protein